MQSNFIKPILTLMFFLKKTILFLFVCCSSFISAQTGIVSGHITDKFTNKPLPFVNVQIIGTTNGATTDEQGNFEIKDLAPKIYNVKASFVGYKEITAAEIQVTNSKAIAVNFAMEQTDADLKEIVVKASPFKKTEESPVSLRTIGVTEIARNPGGNRDISKVIQSLPGVTSTAAFRNDLIIRGGAPNENRFYLDDVEVPNINHFATQGSSGGPVGMINVNFIKEVDFYSGAFPSNRGNTLSSVFNFAQRDGRSDKWGFSGTIGSSDIGITAEGPVGNKTTVVFSARRSYLQLLFKAIGLPFLPTYTDFQFKVKHKINDKNEITFIGLNAYDEFSLDTANHKSETNRYLLDNLPVSPQRSHTTGIVWKHFDQAGYWTFVVSRNKLHNEAKKYFQNDDTKPTNLTLDYLSEETENKLRAEHTSRFSGFKLNYGVSYDYVQYYNKTFQKLDSVRAYNYETSLNLNRYAAFAQLSKSFLQDKLTLSAGLRMDGIDYNDKMSNPLNQLSPRFSLSYAFSPQLSFNANTGIFYQLPPYTALGFQNAGVFVNKNNLNYIQAAHFVAGFEYTTKTDSKISIEGYYKKYSNYPFLTNKGVSLANLGGDFGVVGNEPAISNNEGRTYGVEALFQQRLFNGFYGILAYTFGRSEFADAKGNFAPSSWDSRHIFALTGGKQLGKNWEIGIKWRYQTGLPYTPDNTQSTAVAVWNNNGRALPDYSLLNTERTNASNRIDLRVDKKWFGKKATWNLYLDVQNVLSNAVIIPITILDLPLDANKKPIGNATTYIGKDGITYYNTKQINNTNGNATPSIGLQVDF